MCFSQLGKKIENNNAHCRLQKFISHKEEKTKKQQCIFILDFDSLFIWKKENNNGTFQETSKDFHMQKLWKNWVPLQVVGHRKMMFFYYPIGDMGPTNSLLTTLAFGKKKLWILFKIQFIYAHLKTLIIRGGGKPKRGGRNPPSNGWWTWN